MANSIGRKGHFGVATTRLLEEVVKDKEQDSTGNIALSKSGRRALKKSHGRSISGRKTTTKTTFKTANALRDVDLSRILDSAGKKTISYKGDRGLHLNSYDSKIQNPILKFFHNEYKHLTANKDKNKSVPKMFGNMLKETVKDELAKAINDSAASNATKRTISEYNRVLDRVVDLQMKHFQTPLGRRNMQLETLARISSAVDALTEDVVQAIKVSSENGTEVDCGYMERLEQWLSNLEKHHGHNDLNSFIRDIHKVAVDNKVVKELNENNLPQSEKEVLEAIRTFKTSMQEANNTLNNDVEVRGDVVLLSSIYSKMQERIANLPLPISEEKAQGLLQVMSKLRDTCGIRGGLEIKDILPGEGVINSGTMSKNTQYQDSIVDSYINLVEIVQKRVAGDYGSNPILRENMTRIEKVFPNMSTYMKFVDSAKNYMDSGAEYDLDEQMNNAKNDSVARPHAFTAFVNTMIQSAIKNPLKHDPIQGNIRDVLVEAGKNIQNSVDEDTAQNFRVGLERRLSKTSDNVHGMRLRRFGKGLYNATFGQTLAGQATRTAFRTAVLALGGAGLGYVAAAAINPALFGIISSGGNATIAGAMSVLVQKLMLKEALVAGATLVGVGVASSIPYSGLRGRSIRKLNKLHAEGEEAKPSHRLHHKKKTEKQETARIMQYNDNKEKLSSEVKNVFNSYKNATNKLQNDGSFGERFYHKGRDIGRKANDMYENVVDVRESERATYESEDALSEVVEGSLLMGAIANVDAVLKEQKDKGRLYKSGSTHMWKEQYNTMSHDEISRLAGALIEAKAFRDIESDDFRQKHLEYSAKILEKGLENEKVDTSLETLVNSLNETQAKELEGSLLQFQEALPGYFNSSVFAKEALQLIQDGDFFEEDDEDTPIGGTSPSPSDLEPAQVYTVKGMNEIQGADIYDAVYGYRFMPFVKEILHQYSPYTTVPIPSNGIIKFMDQLNDTHKNQASLDYYRGAFLTELANSVKKTQQEDKNTVIGTLLNIAGKYVPETDSYVLKEGVATHNAFRRASENDQIRVVNTDREGDKALENQLNILKLEMEGRGFNIPRASFNGLDSSQKSVTPAVDTTPSTEQKITAPIAPQQREAIPSRELKQDDGYKKEMEKIQEQVRTSPDALKTALDLITPDTVKNNLDKRTLAPFIRSILKGFGQARDNGAGVTPNDITALLNKCGDVKDTLGENIASGVLGIMVAEMEDILVRPQRVLKNYNTASSIAQGIMNIVGIPGSQGHYTFKPYIVFPKTWVDTKRECSPKWEATDVKDSVRTSLEGDIRRNLKEDTTSVEALRRQTLSELNKRFSRGEQILHKPKPIIPPKPEIEQARIELGASGSTQMERIEKAKEEIITNFNTLYEYIQEAHKEYVEKSQSHHTLLEANAGKAIGLYGTVRTVNNWINKSRNENIPYTDEQKQTIEKMNKELKIELENKKVTLHDNVGTPLESILRDGFRLRIASMGHKVLGKVIAETLKPLSTAMDIINTQSKVIPERAKEELLYDELIERVIIPQ